MNEKQNFTSGSILLPLVRFTLPILFALCLQSMYGAVDLWVVGQFGQAADVSGVVTGGQIMQTVTNVIASLSAGATILLGQYVGRNDRKRAATVVGTATALFTMLALCLTGVMIFAAKPFAAALQTPPEALEQTLSYVRICSAGAVCIVGYNLVGSIFRGLGDSKTPLIAVLAACVCNIAGDLLLVGGLEMGVAGAALATVFAQLFSVVLSLFRLRRRGVPFPTGKEALRPQRDMVRKILKLGVPIALQDALVSVSFLSINAIVNRLGVIPSAGVGVAGRICGFIMLVPSAFMQSLSAFVAQNIGAEKPQRARRALLCGIGTSLCFALVLSWLSFFHGELLAGLFVKNRQVIEAAVAYLKGYAIDTLLVSFHFCFSGYFSGCGRTKFVMLQGITGAFGVRVPVSYLMSRQKPVSLFRVGLATPLSSFVQLLLCGGYFLIWRRKDEQMLGETKEFPKNAE